MARFYGEVGYADSVETASDSGVWEDVITEVFYYGDVLRDTKKDEKGDSLSDNIVINNSISIVTDEHALKHFHKIKYVMWQGERWTVTNVEVKHPRLILSLGEVYNGPTP
jgi:hypothetical protein